jgi:hypothetical protein
MKKYAFPVVAMAAAIAIPSAAFADTVLAPTDADLWFWTGNPSCDTSCGTTIPGPLDGASYGTDTAVQFYLSNISTNSAVLWWGPEQVGATLGSLASFSASVVNVGSDLPYYTFYFTDPGGISGATTGDDIEMIEFEANTLSGPDDDTLALDPGATLFNIWDASTGGYIEGGQQDALTLDQWLALDPDLDNVSTWVGIQIGAAGGCPEEGSCSETLTINSADVAVVTPEPTSTFLLGTGLAGLAGMLRRKLKG